MICPKCGTEYREGFTECAYCHIPLVEALEEGVDPEELLRYSEKKSLGSQGQSITREEFIEICREKGLSDRDIIKALQEMTDEDEISESAGYEDEDAPSPGDGDAGSGSADSGAERQAEERDYSVKPYRKAGDRAEDMRTSAYTLLLAGVLGLIAVFLLYAGAFPVKLTGSGKYITLVTMTGVFALFLITGINSYRKIGALLEEADREEKKIEEIRKFFFDSYTAESLDREALESGNTAAGEYFLRTSFMRNILNERYMDLDPSFLEYIIEDLYNAIYEGGGEA